VLLKREELANVRGAAAARRLVAQFAGRTERGAFPNIPREKVAVGLLSHIDQPEVIRQGQLYLCGPAAFMYTFAKHDIAAYTQFVIDLYERGDATICTLRVTPSASFRFDRMPANLIDSEVDWIALGSLRDSSNWFFQYHTNELPFFNAATRSDDSRWTWEDTRGSTKAREIRSWLTQLGYTEVVDKTSGRSTSSLDNLRDADRRFRNGEKVVLRICANILLAKTRQEAAAGGGGDHFIVLASQIEFASTIQFRLYTWGGLQFLPFRLTPDEFLNSYYGFVAARR
jgi:hypothetical protein